MKVNHIVLLNNPKIHTCLSNCCFHFYFSCFFPSSSVYSLANRITPINLGIIFKILDPSGVGFQLSIYLSICIHIPCFLPSYPPWDDLHGHCILAGSEDTSQQRMGDKHDRIAKFGDNRGIDN